MPDRDSTVADFLRSAIDRWRSVETFEQLQRKEGKTDLQFLNLEQWDSQDKTARQAVGKHALVIDQIGEPYRQLVGQQRQARPAIQVSPVDSGADLDTAEVYQTFIRHIEMTGHAKPARDEAFKYAAACGWGYYRILLDWEYDQLGSGGPQDAALFDQCIKYQAIEDPFTVYMDPACPLLAPWQARFCFVTEDIPKEEFKRRWPNAIATSGDAFASTGVNVPDWFPETSVKVADYLYVEVVKEPAEALLSDGRVVPAAQAAAITAAPAAGEITPVTVLQTRTPLRRLVKIAKITGAEILEGNDTTTAGRDWPGQFIPVIRICGESLTVDGKRTLRGLVRPSRDLMRAYNYEVSELLYELACSPKSKVLMPNGAQIGHEEQWKRAPAQAFPYLLYEPVVATAAGQIVNVPEPTVAHFTDSAKIQALVLAIQQLKTDLRTITGWYDPTDPSRRNTDQSGRAILARKESQNEGAVNYKENYGFALLVEAMYLLDLIPKVYARPGRVLRLLGDEGADLDPVTVGGAWKKPRTKTEGVFVWGAGRYDVAASIGASYLTRRQEATDQGLKLLEILDPQQRAVLTPSIVSNMDMPGSQQLAAKLKKTLPPELQDEQDAQQIPPHVQQQIQQMEQLLEAVTKELNSKNDLIEKDQLTLESQAQTAQAEIASKERIEAAKLETERYVADLQARIKLDLAEFELKKTLGLAEIDARQATLSQQRDQDHARDLAERQTPPEADQ